MRMSKRFGLPKLICDQNFAVFFFSYYILLQILQITMSGTDIGSGSHGAGDAELNRSFEDEDDDVIVESEGGRRRIFSKEIKCMLYGFGDDKNPYTETVEFLEDLVMEFITDMTHKCMDIGRPGRVMVEDIIFLVRKHPRMYARVRELLTMNEELKKARKAFDEVKYVQVKIMPFCLPVL